MKLLSCFLLSAALLCSAELKVRLSWSNKSPASAKRFVRLVPGQGATIRYETRDADGITAVLVYRERPSRRLQNLHVIWADLIANSDPATARRLSRDPAFTPGAPRFAVHLNPEGTRGFSVTVNQLLREKAMWIPALDIFLTAGEPVSLAEHRHRLTGQRVLEAIRLEPEATYEQYTSRWPDMGHPSYTHARSTGHVVGLAWDSSIPKFGIDRWAGVVNDLANPDKFQFWLELKHDAQGVSRTWRGQRLDDGLPVVTTSFEHDGVAWEVEQFAYPLNGPPKERQGDIAMVLMQKVTAAELRGRPRRVGLTIGHRRRLPQESTLAGETQDGSFLAQDNGGRILFSVQGAREVEWSGVRDYQKEQKRLNATAFVDLPAKGSRELVVKLPSAPVTGEGRTALLAIDYAKARRETTDFWSGYVARGAQFRVPEKAVNDLVRANLWHALRLPRRHGGEGQDVKIDLPYSNFAYGQSGTPWPVNQAVYVDYMLYDLRGYHDISAEELLAQYRNNQEENGHVKGVANWLVYTPGMLYAVAQNYLLSRDRGAFEKLLPASLKAMDWCLAEIRRSSERSGPTHGLVVGPLNDGTGEGIWAFNQAYLHAGLQLFGRALREAGHPRAGEALDAAHVLRESIAAGFGAASVNSPLVQLRDGTWVPYVPCEALTYGRILDQWYATDVDTGAVHLPRLDALPPESELADFLLNDHEDNLYLKGWGMANEPVYNQQGLAYLRRDDPKTAIRTFYSYMASAFSHSMLEPVEHRWTHGQYFGPPSTDGAFFELFRNMLIRELEDGTLLIGQAAPRRWLEDGKRIEVTRAPTYFGRLSMKIESRVASGTIRADIDLEGPKRPSALLVRLRHPQARRMRFVTVNGSGWRDFDAAKEWVRISTPAAPRYEVTASY